MTDQTIEQEIQAKGLTSPRITPADIEANIASGYYFTASDGVDGADIGRKIARQNAVEKVWPLMGYELRSILMAT